MFFPRDRKNRLTELVANLRYTMTITELLKISGLTMFLACGPAAADVARVMDFGKEGAGGKWFAVNDGVMGGLSKGGPEIKEGVLRFTGNLSMENNGGFSSIRVDGKHDFSGKKTVVLKVKGDGRTYQLRLATDARYRQSAVSYGADFVTEKGKWIEVRVPIASLFPSWRGMKLDGLAFDASKVEEIGILLGDKKPGDFILEIGWIGVE